MYGPRFPEGYVKTDQWYEVSFQFCPERSGAHSGDFDSIDRIEMSKAFAQYIAAKMAQSVDEDPSEFFERFVVKNLTIREDDFISDDAINAWLNPED